MTLDVSIVIPTYNQNPKFLTEAIESALHQSYPKNKYEILVVDDGSSRILPEIVTKKFEKEKQLRLIKKNHGGIGHTLNVGINEMHGNYFKWLSSDDVLVENSLEIFMSYSGEKKILYGDWLKIDGDSEIIGVYHEPVFKNQAAAQAQLWRSYFGNGSASLIPKSAFNEVGLFDSLPYYEDYDWWLRAMFLHDYCFEHVNNIVAKYRYHSSQLTLNLKANPVDRALMNWMIRQRVYSAMKETDRSNVNPAPTLKLLSKQLLLLEASILYNKFNGSKNDPANNKWSRLPSILQRILENHILSKGLL